MSLTTWIAAIAASYLIGSFPTSILLSRLLRQADPRTTGSGHTGGLNAARTMGLAAGILVVLVDVAKGALATWLALVLASSPWSLALGGFGAVAGHCWPLATRLQGGMGLSTGFGSLLVTWAFLGVWPWPVLAVAVAWYVANRLLHHIARAILLAVTLLAPLYWLAGAPGVVLVQAVAISAIVFVRYLSDVNRVYE